MGIGDTGIECSSIASFFFFFSKFRMSGSKYKSNGGVANTAKKCQGMTMKTKVKMGGTK